MKFIASVQPSETDKAYAAGFIDGESSLSVVRQPPNFYRPQVDVAQKDRTPLLWLAMRWGGSIGRPGKA